MKASSNQHKYNQTLQRKLSDYISDAICMFNIFSTLETPVDLKYPSDLWAG